VILPELMRQDLSFTPIAVIGGSLLIGACHFVNLLLRDLMERKRVRRMFILRSNAPYSGLVIRPVKQFVYPRRTLSIPASRADSLNDPT